MQNVNGHYNFSFSQYCNTAGFCFISFTRWTQWTQIKLRELTDMHALVLKRKITTIINISHYSYLRKKWLSGIKPWEMSMWAGRVRRRVCLVLSWVKRSRVRTAGRPTDSPRAAGGAPLHAGPRPWCRPGRSLHPGPTYRRSCHGTQSTQNAFPFISITLFPKLAAAPSLSLPLGSH